MNKLSKTEFARFTFLYSALGLCWFFAGCTSMLNKNTSKAGTLEATIAACQNAQHQHYLLTGKAPKGREEDQNEIIPYRIYEGVPNFVFQECMKENLTR